MPTSKTRALLLMLALSVLSATAAAKAPDFTIQVPYTGANKTATARQDYYLFVNTDWLTKTKIPTDKGKISTLVETSQAVDKQLTHLTQTALRHQAAGKANRDEQNIAKLYACIQDQKGRTKAGLGDLAPLLKRVENISSLQEYAETMAYVSASLMNVQSLLGDFYLIKEPLKNDRYVVRLSGPDILSREMLENKNNEVYFSQYRSYISKLLQKYGRSPQAAAQSAQAIFDLQKDLGLHAYTVAEWADPSKINHKLSLSDLQGLYSHINVEAMLNAGGIGPKAGQTSWYLANPSLIAYFNSLYTPKRLPLLKDYALFSLLSTHCAFLDQDYQKLAEDFQQQSTGAKALPAPGQRDLLLNMSLLKSTYGRQYAHTYFSDAKKQAVKAYVELILNEYRKKLQQLNWMTPATKQMALKKLATMQLHLGYPDAWPEYLDQLNIKSPQEGGCLINNQLALSKQLAQWNNARVGTPVRTDLWTNLTPQTVNAYYFNQDNSINFPAGILQPPYFDSKADRETNLGGIGAVIAHEITHCFDNNGAQFDELGRHRNWWQPSDFTEFKSKQQKIIDYYSRYLLTDGTRLNGTQTLSENIADLGGLACITSIIGHNPEGLRRAYRNYGLIWRNKSTDRSLQLELANIHALPYVRVDGVLSSTDGFYEAYDIKPGDAMYVVPADRAKLW